METRETEEWREIPGLNGRYYASTEGRVASFLDYKSGRELRPLTPATNQTGHLTVSLYMPEERLVTKSVHRLVAKAFLDDPVEGKCVHHINNDPADNRPENLEVVTRAENTRRAYEEGLIEGNYTPKEDAIRAVALALIGETTVAAIADVFGMSGGNLSAMIHQRSRPNIRVEAEKLLESFEQDYTDPDRFAGHGTYDDETAVEAVYQYLTTDASQKEIAGEFGMSNSHLSRLVNGKQRPDVLEQAKMKAS